MLRILYNYGHSELSSEDGIEMDYAFKILDEQNVFILHNGEIEDYYNNSKIQKIKQENKLSGKEVISHYISAIINHDNLNRLLNIDNDFKDYIEKIIKKYKGLLKSIIFSI